MVCFRVEKTNNTITKQTNTHSLTHSCSVAHPEILQRIGDLLQNLCHAHVAHEGRAVARIDRLWIDQVVPDGLPRDPVQFQQGPPSLLLPLVLPELRERHELLQLGTVAVPAGGVHHGLEAGALAVERRVGVAEGPLGVGVGPAGEFHSLQELPGHQHPGEPPGQDVMMAVVLDPLLAHDGPVLGVHVAAGLAGGGDFHHQGGQAPLDLEDVADGQVVHRHRSVASLDDDLFSKGGIFHVVDALEAGPEALVFPEVFVVLDGLEQDGAVFPDDLCLVVVFVPELRADESGPGDEDGGF
eukprot:CAMPEP_0201121904 /NCGR_PEP_ID=MMETSP0850-20130426/5669_1 /ASSEMBLY_ACC=CAM_ASM_000622 /TAXON_ID=183588 /ORGANISM="Pseudo-nitzschia fraudulenta, Strain WWA7" /LENGTH=297 /DNA_ID=CAMNT_0047388471 /DNA_START=482 /DNA_END=1372 /DNA_ORIENTATION=+